MWAVVAFLVLWVITSVIFVVALAAVPSSVRASNNDMITAVSIAGLLSGALTLLGMGIAALFGAG